MLIDCVNFFACKLNLTAPEVRRLNVDKLEVKVKQTNNLISEN